MPLSHSLILATLLFSVSSTRARAQEARQARDVRQEDIARILEGAYNPPANESQLRSCKYTALTRGLLLDSGRSDAVRRAILIERPIEPRTRLRWEESRALMRARDSALLAAMPGRNDSARMQRNIESEAGWWASGACNGKPVPRRPPAD